MSFRPKIAVLFGARTLGLFALSRILTRSRLRILCYHAGAIGDESGYNPKLFCSAKLLRERMTWMTRRGFRFETLDEGIRQQAGAEAKAPLRTVLTFDDGWYSTASELLPVLAGMQIPSTLYLSTKNFLEGWPILNVTVRYIIWKAGARSVKIQGWGVDVDDSYDLALPRERQRLAAGIVKAIESAASGREQVCDALNRLAVVLNIPAEALQLESRRFDYVTREEATGLRELGCSVELHGHVHEYPAGDPVRLAEDLYQCAATIVELGLPQPRHYCYPSGSFGVEAAAALHGIGVLSATTCIPGLVSGVGGERRYYLPRFLDGEDVHQLEFEAEMSGFSELMRNALRIFRRR